MAITEATRGRPPLILLEDEESLGEIAAELALAGWAVRDGFSLQERAWRVGGMRPICQGVVATPADAAAALLAAARGAGLVVAVPERDMQERLFEDLRRVGPVEIRHGSSNPGAKLDRRQLEVLTLLADGASLDDAARLLNYSRRTVERRLAAARGVLGAATTAEALLRFKGRAGRNGD